MSECAHELECRLIVPQNRGDGASAWCHCHVAEHDHALRFALRARKFCAQPRQLHLAQRAVVGKPVRCNTAVLSTDILPCFGSRPQLSTGRRWTPTTAKQEKSILTAKRRAPVRLGLGGGARRSWTSHRSIAGPSTQNQEGRAVFKSTSTLLYSKGSHTRFSPVFSNKEGLSHSPARGNALKSLREIGRGTGRAVVWIVPGLW